MPRGRAAGGKGTWRCQPAGDSVMKTSVPARMTASLDSKRNSQIMNNFPQQLMFP